MHGRIPRALPRLRYMLLNSHGGCLPTSEKYAAWDRFLQWPLRKWAGSKDSLSGTRAYWRLRLLTWQSAILFNKEILTMDCFPAVSSLKIFTSSISFRLACRTTTSSCGFFNTLAFGWGLEMERTLESNVFPEMFEEQDIRSSKVKIIGYLSWIEVRFKKEKKRRVFWRRLEHWTLRINFHINLIYVYLSKSTLVVFVCESL